MCVWRLKAVCRFSNGLDARITSSANTHQNRHCLKSPGKIAFYVKAAHVFCGNIQIAKSLYCRGHGEMVEWACEGRHLTP